VQIDGLYMRLKRIGQIRGCKEYFIPGSISPALDLRDVTPGVAQVVPEPVVHIRPPDVKLERFEWYNR
jgi:hypothetical protein